MNRYKKILFPLMLILAVFFTACKLEQVGVKDDPVFSKKSTKEGESSVIASYPDADKVVYQWFDDDYMPGGYNYAYPPTSNVKVVVGDGYNSESSLEFNLDANDYSGGAICLYNMKYDLTPYYNTGILRFWVKARTGNEKFEASLVDDDGDGKKTVVRAWVYKYATLKAGEWVRVDIPLRDFGKRGVYWDEKKRVEVPSRFQWNMVTEFRIEIKKADNEAPFKILVDNIQILKDMVEPVEEKEVKYWDEITEVINGPENPNPESLENIIAKFFEDDLPPGGFTYVYGGKTACRPQESQTKGNEQIFAAYMDDNDYSGVTISLGTQNVADLSPYLKHGGLEFWVKGKKGGEKFYIGLLDDESDGPEKKVQTKVSSQDYVQVTTEWKLVKILFKRFPKNGKWWNSSKKAEVFGQVDWSKIQEIRFSINKFENKKLLSSEDEPVTLYFDQIQLVKEIKGVFDPEEYWAKFNSNEPDVLITDFENDETNAQWETPHGQNSEIKAEFVPPPKGKKECGKKSLKVTYKLRDWADCVWPMAAKGAPMKIRDWSKHWGIKFWFYTDKPYEAITVQVQDAGNEVFTATTGAIKGWHELLVPFKSFEKFPYWQPDDAEQNGIFDLKGVRTLDFKPANDGTNGTFYVDNVYLTNQREIKVEEAKALDIATVEGDATKVLHKINPEIYGINIALWDGDLLKPETIKYCRAIKHRVYRYPGGLRADDDHWEEVLKKKDWMVDTEEAAQFAEDVNGELMITVNFGKGTPEEAARWVEHMNVKLKKKVRFWEVGNELYGEWHPNHCTPEFYGKKARIFIEKMKAVDPDIKVTVVWVLDGDWNKIVFDYTKDIADGVNVHHYPQHYGQENDYALLAAPTSVPEILGGVIEQTKKYGEPGKKYEVWLTEWNSVDFNPGPQTVSVVNGLFVADYLAHLAKVNIEIANYWDVHNDITPQLGDYGYLSRTGAPDGDNVPRSSYWAFKLVANNLQGKLNDVKSSTDNVTAYLSTREDGSQALLLVNKSPKTDYKVKLNIKGLKGGNAIVETYYKVATKTKNGFTWDETKIDRENKTINNGDEILVKKYTATVIQFGTSKSHTDVE